MSFRVSKFIRDLLLHEASALIVEDRSGDILRSNQVAHDSFVDKRQCFDDRSSRRLVHASICLFNNLRRKIEFDIFLLPSTIVISVMRGFKCLRY